MRRFVILAIALAFAAPSAGAHASDGCSWSMYGHDTHHTFAQTPDCAQISQLNASTLHPKWYVSTNSPVTAQPAVVDGEVYVGSYGGTFYAINATTGNVDWTRDVTDKTSNSYGKIVSSASVDTIGGTKVIAIGGGATLFLLNAKDGSVLDSLCFDPHAADPSGPCQTSTDYTVEIEASPIFVHTADGGTELIVGMDFNETRDVGRAGVVAVAIDNFKLVPQWKFDPETLQTYRDQPLSAGGLGHGCGNVWSTPAIDQPNDLVVFGIGNCDVPGSGEPGNEESIDAIHLSDGSFVWRYAPRDPKAASSLDLDFGSSAQVLPDGTVGEGGKDGYYYKFSETQASQTAKPLWTSHVSTPSDIGGMIGSTAQGKVCAPSAQAPGAACQDAIFATSAIPISTSDPQTSFQDAFTTPQHAFALHAISVADGHTLWDAPLPFPAYSAATYSNGVVFLGDTFGFSVQAYNADTGTLLWGFPLGAPSSAPAIVGDSIYVGAGTAGDPIPAQAVNPISGIAAFQAVVP